MVFFFFKGKCLNEKELEKVIAGKSYELSDCKARTQGEKAEWRHLDGYPLSGRFSAGRGVGGS